MKKQWKIAKRKKHAFSCNPGLVIVSASFIYCVLHIPYCVLRIASCSIFNATVKDDISIDLGERMIIPCHLSYSSPKSSPEGLRIHVILWIRRQSLLLALVRIRVIFRIRSQRFASSFVFVAKVFSWHRKDLQNICSLFNTSRITYYGSLRFCVETFVRVSSMPWSVISVLC